MTGVKYYRILHKLSREKLAALTSIRIPTLKKMEDTLTQSDMCFHYRKVSLALQVSVDKLVRSDFPDPNIGARIGSLANPRWIIRTIVFQFFV